MAPEVALEPAAQLVVLAPMSKVEGSGLRVNSRRGTGAVVELVRPLFEATACDGNCPLFTKSACVDDAS